MSKRIRYFFNNFTKPGTVAISTKQFEMSVMYQGCRFLPYQENLAEREINLPQIYGYHSFDIEAEAGVHAAFQELHTGKIHAVTEMVLTEVEGEFKWEPTLVKMLS